MELPLLLSLMFEGRFEIPSYEVLNVDPALDLLRIEEAPILVRLTEALLRWLRDVLDLLRDSLVTALTLLLDRFSFMDDFWVLGLTLWPFKSHSWRLDLREAVDLTELLLLREPVERLAEFILVFIWSGFDGTVLRELWERWVWSLSLSSLLMLAQFRPEAFAYYMTVFISTLSCFN